MVFLFPLCAMLQVPNFWSVSNAVPFEHSSIWSSGSNVLVVLCFLAMEIYFLPKKQQQKVIYCRINSKHNRQDLNEKNEKIDSHHIGNEQDVHVSSENYEENGYGLDLDLLIIP